MTDKSLTGEALFAQVRTQLGRKPDIASFTETERNELAQWANKGEPVSVEDGTQARDLMFEASLHRIAIKLMEEYGANSIGDLPPEAFKYRKRLRLMTM